MLRLLLKYKNWQKGLERERGFNSFLSLKGEVIIEGGLNRGFLVCKIL